MPCGTPQHTLPPPPHKSKAFPVHARCLVLSLHRNHEQRPDAVHIHLWETVLASGTVLQSIQCRSTPHTNVPHFSTKQQDIVTASFLPFVFPLQQSTRTLIKCAEGRRLSLLFPAVGCDKKRGRREGHRRKMLKRANIIPTTMSTTTTNSVCVCGPQNRLPASPPSPLATTAPTKKEKKKKNTEQSVIKLATLNQPTQSRILASRPPTSQLKQQS